MKTQIEINGCKLLKKGIKSPSGKYYPAWYSRGVLINGIDTITIYAKSILLGLPKELGQVQNDSEMMADYFEKDRVRFEAGTKQFSAVLPLTLQDA